MSVLPHASHAHAASRQRCETGVVRPLTRLQAGDAPWLHRVAHSLTSAGLRGSNLTWKFVGEPEASAGCHLAGAGPLRLQTANPAECSLYRGQYELDELMITSALVPPGGVCWDVGANIGIYTLLLSGLVGATGVVEAFEPSPVAWERLMLHVESCDNVRAYRVALSDRSGTARLAVAGGDSMHSTLRSDSGVPGYEVDAATVTTDSRMDDEGIPFLDFVKVDIEGHEARFVAGANRALGERKIGALLFEVAPQYGSTTWVDELAQVPGYELFAIVRRDNAWPMHRPRLSARSVGSFLATGHGFSLAVISDEGTAKVAKLIVD